MQKKTESVLVWFIVVLILLTVFVGLKVKSDIENINNYEVSTCYNTEQYVECIYGLSKWRAMKAAAAYGKDKDCVESRVEYLNDSYNLYFRRCNVFEK